MSRMMPLLCIVSCHFEIIIYWHFSTSMFSFSDDVLKGMLMGEVMTLLTSVSGHPLVKSFSGADVIQQPFSTGKLFNVSEEPVSDLQSLSALLQRLENDPTHTVIRGSLMEGQSSLVPRKMEFFTVTPRQWCMIDIDSLAWEGDLSDQQAMLSYASQQLPAEFQATDCWYHLSSSMLGGFVRRRNIHACGLAQISFPSWYFRAIMCLV